MKKITDYSDRLYDNLLKQLSGTMDADKPLLQRIEKAITQCDNALTSLRDYFDKHSFDDPAEEIRFFKVLKPRFVAQLLYYLRLYQLHGY